MSNKSKLSGLAAAIAGSCAVLYTVNTAAFKAANSKNLLNSMETSCYSWKYGNIYYTKTGQGKPLVLIHSMDAFSSAYEWHEIQHLLAKQRTLYMIDLPGFGRSDRDQVLYTQFFYAKAISDFVSEVVSEKADIVTSGDSSSCVISALACEPCDLIDKVIMINPESFDQMIGQEGRNDRKISKIMELPLTGTFAYVMAVNKSQLKKRFKEVYFENPVLIKDDMVDAFYEAAHLGGEKARFSETSRLARYTKGNISGALGKIDRELYLIRGSKVADGAKNAKIYRHFAKDIHEYVIPTTKLMPHMEKPLVVAKTILAILEK